MKEGEKKMKRVISIALVTALAISLCACGGKTENSPAASSTEKINLTVAYADPEDSVFGKGANAFAEKLEELSGGTITCTMYPGSSSYDPTGNM